MYRTAWRCGFTLVEMMIVVSIIGLLMGLLIPAVMQSRAAARRLQCQNHLKQLGLASHLFESSFKSFPAGTDSPESRTPYQSWFVELLPYLEQEAIFRENAAAYQTDSDPFNLEVHRHFETSIAVFACPEFGRSGSPVWSYRFARKVSLTAFQGCNGTNHKARDGVLFLDSKVAFRDISDGASQTLFAGERVSSVSNDYGWWYAGVGALDGTLDHTIGTAETAQLLTRMCSVLPQRFRIGDEFDECSQRHFWSKHSGGGNFVFCDGSVRFLSYSCDVMDEFATRAKGETFDPGE